MARKRPDLKQASARGLETGKAIQSRRMLDEVAPSLVKLDHIQDREADTRPIDLDYAAELALSIAELGLITAITLDKNYRLLAGGHRRAALLMLRGAAPDDYQAAFAQALSTYHNDLSPQKAYKQNFPGDMIPCRVMPFAAADDLEMALLVEVAENEKRKNYTHAQILKIAGRLQTMGYEEVTGRPTKGQKPLRPALSIALGVSRRYVSKVLNSGTEKKDEQVLSSQKSLIGRALGLMDKLSTVMPEEYEELHRAIPGFRKKLINCARSIERKQEDQQVEE